MIARRFPAAAAVVALAVAGFPSPSPGDEAADKLVNAHEQAVRTARLPLHRKLLTELRRLKTTYEKEGKRAEIAAVDAEIERVNRQIAEASLPVAGGPQPRDFKLLTCVGGYGLLTSWENGLLEMESRGFSWQNKTLTSEMILDRVLEGPFEATVEWTGNACCFSLLHADYSKKADFYYLPIAAGDGKHSMKVKRTASGIITAEFDNQTVALKTASPETRPDMYMRLSLRLDREAKVTVRNITIKEPASKKP